MEQAQWNDFKSREEVENAVSKEAPTMIWADVPRKFLPLTENLKYCKNNESLYAKK